MCTCYTVSYVQTFSCVCPRLKLRVVMCIYTTYIQGGCENSDLVPFIHAAAGISRVLATPAAGAPGGAGATGCTGFAGWGGGSGAAARRIFN